MSFNPVAWEAALWRFGRTVLYGAAVAGLQAVIVYLQTHIIPDWKKLGWVFLLGALLSLDKYVRENKKYK